MTDLSDSGVGSSSSSHEAPSRRVCPSNAFVPFAREEIDQSLPERFEAQVGQHEDWMALDTRTNRLTYGELNAQANRLARVISSRCASDRTPIAVLLENDAGMIVAMLAVMKSGNIHVPLDPHLPAARTSFIVEHSQAKLLVTNSRNVETAEELIAQKLVLNVDELATDLPTDDLRLSVAPDSPAWILYTSGSTGQPKGVVQTHRNVLHYVMNYTNGLHMNSDDRLTLLFSCSVNAGCHDIFTALLNGASLHMWDIRQQGLAGLSDWLVQHAVTIYCSVPTVFRHFVDTLRGGEQFPDVRLIKLAGEPVCKREPVGYPVEDNEILLLDEDGNEVEPGEIGEIAVKSRYLSPGYWRRPDLTEASFLPDPKGGDERIYLTGDMGRMLAGGLLVHHGRKDFQVKIRGYRIEVAEIEAALLELDSVKETIVLAREDQPGEPRLVAYIVPAGKSAPTVTELRRHVCERIPDYMAPSAFVTLEALPLAPNGKVYLKGLPAPDRSRPELEAAFVAPRTPIEEALADIWAEVLDLEEVGVNDNFLELGGHSLLAAQVISRVLRRCQVEVPLQSLYEAPTVARMAVVITERLARKASPEDLARLLAELEDS
ncbi:MAG: AMP-binding protein [Planctomycetota bacterium]|jgi:acyl-coenzyme A synthetase/AMP-(fatty) acid ligase/acyl carrier protein